MDKANALKENKGNFDKRMHMSHDSISDIKWWVTSIPGAYNPVSHGETQITLSTDASFNGWGVCIDTTTTGGNWTPEERAHDINYLEMLAAFLALKSFSSAIKGKHVKLQIDNLFYCSMLHKEYGHLPLNSKQHTSGTNLVLVYKQQCVG